MVDKHCPSPLSRFLRSFSKSGGEGAKKPVVPHQEPLEHILKDRFLSDAFHDWATQNLCSENLMFYHEVEKFKTIRDINLMRAEAHRIYARYVRARSVAEVNLDYECRVTIEESLDNPTPSLFDEAKFAVLDLIKYDLYLKFIDSDIYRDCKGLPSVHKYPIQRRRNVHLADLPHLTHEQISSLSSCLRDPLALDEFLKFAYKEFSDAVIQFYLDAEKYEASPSLEFACSIYGKYLGDSSEEAVDADPNIKKDILQQIQLGLCPPQLFSLLKNTIFSVMSQDNFMRFQNFVISSLAMV